MRSHIELRHPVAEGGWDEVCVCASLTRRYLGPLLSKLECMTYNQIHVVIFEYQNVEIHSKLPYSKMPNLEQS